MEVKDLDERKIKLMIGVIFAGIEEVLSEFYDDSDKIYNYDFFDENFNIKDSEILDLVIYKNAEEIERANLKKSSLAYINLAAKNFSGGKNNKGEKDNSPRTSELKSIFNILNENNKNGKYQAKFLSHEDGINYPDLGEVKFNLNFFHYKPLLHIIVYYFFIRR